MGAGVTAPADVRQGSREAERLARVLLGRLVEAGNARVAALVGQFGAGPVVDLMRSGLHDRSWSDTVEQRLEHLDPAADPSAQRAAASGLLCLARELGLGVGSFVSLGNRADVSSNDLLAA